jgi:hypothetical protein
VQLEFQQVWLRQLRSGMKFKPEKVFITTQFSKMISQHQTGFELHRLTSSRVFPNQQVVSCSQRNSLRDSEAAQEIFTSSHQMICFR